MIDSHAHLELLQNVDEKIKNAKSTGLKAIFTIASNFESNKKVIELSEKYKNYVFPVVGLDPSFCAREKEKIQHVPFEKGIAIGEIGLDYYWVKSSEGRDIQRNLFELQLGKAQELKKTVSIHSREAMNDCLDILKKYDVNVVIHCWSDSEKELKECLKRGYWISFATNACYKKQLENLIKSCPLDRILTETDSPYLHPTRQGKNEPANVKEVVKLISKIKKIDFEEVDKQTEKNAREAFKIC